jgi:ABC-type transport system substrate-binding protein
MSGKKGLLFTMVLTLLLISLLAACAAPAATTQVPITSATATTTQVPTSSVLATTAAATAKPQGELVAALQTFGNENFLPWLDPGSASLDDLIYNLLIFYDHINQTLIPGLAKSWEVHRMVLP